MACGDGRIADKENNLVCGESYADKNIRISESGFKKADGCVFRKQL
jgi:hypothetical protein